MRGHGTALAHLLFLAARRRPHEFGLHGCLLRSHPLTLPTAPISFNFLAVNDIGPSAVLCLVRRRMEEALRVARVDLEARVQERTAELSASNTALQAEVSAREQTGKALQHERDLLAVTLASISDAVIAPDAATALTFLNPVAETL